MAGPRVLETRHARRQPFLLAADRFRVFAAAKARAHGVLELAADLEVVDGARVDGGILTVPRHIPAFGIEDHDALGQQVDGLEEPGLGRSRERQGCLDLGLADHPLHEFGAATELGGEVSPSVRNKPTEAAGLAPPVRVIGADGAGAGHQ